MVKKLLKMGLNFRIVKYSLLYQQSKIYLYYLIKKMLLSFWQMIDVTGKKRMVTAFNNKRRRKQRQRKYSGIQRCRKLQR